MRNCCRYLLWRFPGRPPRTPNAVLLSLKFPQPFPLPSDFIVSTQPGAAEVTCRQPDTGEQAFLPEPLLTPRHPFPSAFPRLPPPAAGAHDPAAASATERGFPGTGSQAAGLKETREPSPGQARPGQTRPAPPHTARLSPGDRGGDSRQARTPQNTR